MIFSYFNFKSQNFNTVGEVLGISQSYFCLVLLLIVMPLINIFLLILANRNVEKLENEIIKELFGVFYEDFENKKIAGLWYQLIYFTRRDIYILASFVLSSEKYKRV